MKTKAFVSYLNRIPVYETDVELVDYASSCVATQNITSADRHPRLSRLYFTPSEKLKRFNHLKATVYDAIIKRMYEMMMDYFTDIVEALVKDKDLASKILGSEAVKYDERELLRIGSWDGLCRLIAENTVRSLEAKRDTGKLITAINTRLNLGIAKTVFADVEPFIEVRHLLVHNAGLADTKFKQKYGKMVKVTKTGEIVVDFGFVQRAQKKMRILVETYDKAIVKKGLVSKAYLQP